jgi:oligopeptide/dipeptide ABC transporter ATP-binding protein
VPVPNPKIERRRKRVILTGDVPSPANPPSGCRFHTRCWLYERLGRPENCRTDDPELRIIGDDHRAACHYAEEALKSDVGVAHVASAATTANAVAEASAAAAQPSVTVPADAAREAP